MRRTTAIAALAVLSLAACGGDDDDASGTEDPPANDGGSGGGEGGAVTVVAESVEGFDSDSYTAAAGEVTIVFENADSIPHNVTIEDEDFRLADDGDEDSIQLEAGEYTLFCDVPGHRDAGMEATLTVE